MEKSKFKEYYKNNKYEEPLITPLSYEIGRIIAECENLDISATRKMVGSILQIKKLEDWGKLRDQLRREEKWYNTKFIETIERKSTCREELSESSIDPKNESWKVMMKKIRNEWTEEAIDEPIEEIVPVETDPKGKIIRKYDLVYNTFMKLGRKVRHRATLNMEDERWRIRSKMVWKDYWKRFNCDNWIYLTIKGETEKTLLNLSCTFSIMEKFGKFETYLVNPESNETAIKYHVKRKVKKILESMECPRIDQMAVRDKSINKVEQFIK
jgi:hypothetical protein